MDPYKYVLKYVILPIWAMWERTPYRKHLKYMLKSQYFSRETIKEIQWQKLKKILHHAYQNSSFYRRKYDEAGINPENIKSFSDFLKIPILSKSEIIRNSEEIYVPFMDKYVPFLTSGSTGNPLRGYRDKACNEFMRAGGMRSNIWAGYDMGERIYCLYGNPEKELKGWKKLRSKIRRKFLYRTEVLNLLKLTEQSMLDFAKKMRKKPPSLLWGHAHALYQLALFYEKKQILDIRPKGMYSAGMVLHDWEKKKIEEIFQCKLQDRYGCEELGLIATECKAQQGLHINTDVHYVEFLDPDGNPVAPGERGSIVITDLTNYVMPFIRYKIEDIGIPSDEYCTCGITQPLIKKIEGRIADFIITPQHELVSGISLTDHFAGQIPGVAQMQIIQNKIDVLNLKVVKNEDFGNGSMEKISHMVEDFFGKEMKFEIDFVEEIPKEASGKFRFTICNLKHDLL